MHQIERLVAADAVPIRWAGRSIHHVWPDFPVQQHIDASCVTIKADAARKTFDADGERIVWAVVDSGIAAEHPHFEAYHTLDHETVRDLHRFFPGNGAAHPGGRAGRRQRARHPRRRHHRRGHRRRGWPASRSAGCTRPRAGYNVENPRQPLRVPRAVDDPTQLAGMAPRARLVSLKVLQRGRQPAGPGAPGDPGAGLRPGGQRGQHGRHAHPRGQPQRRLRVRPAVVRLRPQPAVPGGRQAGAVRRRRGGGGRQLRLRHADGRAGRADEVRPRHDDQRPRQRRAGDHRRLDPPRRAAHLRRVLLLLQGPDRRRARASPTWSRRASGSPRAPPASNLAAVVGGPVPDPTPPSTSRTPAPAWPPRTSRAPSPRCCRCGASSSASPTTSSRSSSTRPPPRSRQGLPGRRAARPDARPADQI